MNKASKEQTEGSRAGRRTTTTPSKGNKLRALDGRVDEGKTSTRRKGSPQREKKASKPPNPIAGLKALDARLEKGQISTRKPSTAFAEAREPSRRRGQSVEPSFSGPTNRYDAASLTAESETRRGRRASSALPSQRVPSYQRAPPSFVTAQGQSSAHYSTHSEAGPFQAPRRVNYEESEHGGSAAFLHARQRSLDARPEKVPLNKRPEIVGGFRTHRSPPSRRETEALGEIEAMVGDNRSELL